MVCFAHFDFEMRFASQRRALLRHLNFQKWSVAEVLCTFWLGNVLRLTTACTFWTSQLPKVVRTWCVLYILTSKCASRHNGVHFFDISTSKSGPNIVCFVHFDFEMCFAPQRRALFRYLNFQEWSERVSCAFWLGNVLRATTAHTFSTSQLPKVIRSWGALYILTSKRASRHNGVTFSTSQLPKVLWTWCVLYILTSKRASRHNGAHFFDISTSKSALNLVCFVHFDLEMCFASQRHALFLNFQKWSEHGVFCTFWLRNALRATTACTFSTSQLPKVVQMCVLCILTLKCALRHKGVQFFISHLASWLCTRRFSEPTFRSSWATITGKTQWIATFLPFGAPASSFFSDLLTSCFLLSDSSNLCFSNCPYCRKFHF